MSVIILEIRRVRFLIMSVMILEIRRVRFLNMSKIILEISLVVLWAPTRPGFQGTQILVCWNVETFAHLSGLHPNWNVETFAHLSG